MDELRGDQAMWGFDGEAVAVEYEGRAGPGTRR